MHDRIQSLEDDNLKLEHRLQQAARYQPKQPDMPGDTQSQPAQPGVVQSQEQHGEVRKEAPADRPAGLDDVKITDQQKEMIFNNLHEKLRRGETLTDKQSQIYQLLLKQGRSNMGGNLDEVVHHQVPPEQLPPDPDGRNQQQQPGVINDRPAFPPKPPAPPPPPPPPGRQQPNGFGVRQQQPGMGQPQPNGFGGRQQLPDLFGVRRQQPDGFGGRQQQLGGFGMRPPEPDGFGGRQQPPDGFRMRRQQPDGFERGQQQPPDGFGGRQQPGFGLRRSPDGMEPHQAHSEQHSPEEQEEVQDIADPGKEGGQQLQFDNLGDEKQQKLNLKVEDEELEGGAQQGFDTGAIVKQAGKDTNTAKQDENDNPLPLPANENQNPDQGFDDYGNNKDEDEGDEEEEYEYEEDRYGDRQLGKDKQGHRKNLNAKIVEHQLQQPALREGVVQRRPEQRLKMCSLIPRPFHCQYLITCIMQIWRGKHTASNQKLLAVGMAWE